MEMSLCEREIMAYLTLSCSELDNRKVGLFSFFPPATIQLELNLTVVYLLQEAFS